MTTDKSGNSGVDTRGRCEMLRPNAMSAAPTLSVVVACKNPGPALTATLESVWAQRHVQPEIVVIDRGSTDGTREWLETQRSRLATTVAALGARHYDALNQGVARATGEWVHFLGAGDRLVGDMILSEALNWARKTDAGVVAGEAAFDDGRICKLGSRVNALARNFVHLQAAFYRRSLFAENGSFDLSFAEEADYEFHVRLWKSRVRFKPIPLRIAACVASERSHRSNRWLRWREECRVRHRYFATWRSLPWDAFSFVRSMGGSKSR